MCKKQHFLPPEKHTLRALYTIKNNIFAAALKFFKWLIKKFNGVIGKK